MVNSRFTFLTLRHSAEQLSAEFEARVEELETELQIAEADSAKVPMVDAWESCDGMLPFGCWTKNRGKPPKSSILIGFSHYFHHPFWGTPIFGNILFNGNILNGVNFLDQHRPTRQVKQLQLELEQSKLAQDGCV